MADFLGNAVSTDILPRKTKKTKTKTKYVTRRPLSKQAIIAIVVVVVVVLIAALILFFIMRRRRKARAAKHMSTLPGYSTDSSNGLYSATPGYAAGNRYGGQQQQAPGGPGGQEMQAAGGYGNFGDTNSSGHYGGGDGGQGGAAADYYGSYAPMQGGGGAMQGRDYGMPQRPPMTFDPSPAPR